VYACSPTHLLQTQLARDDDDAVVLVLHRCFLPQALRLVKQDLDDQKRVRAALEAELETKNATLSTLEGKVCVCVCVCKSV
jgi:hypothetical protein